MGSSPRGRGKRVGAITRARLPRLIPARAGKTSGVCVCTFVHRAHPRAGGENHTLMTDLQTRADSSPRGRGKRARERSDQRAGRLIPARAGKTQVGQQLPFSRPGSSPRGRGKLHIAHMRHHARRLIPARAGKTSAGSQGGSGSSAHPRAGGENMRFSLSTFSWLGSSPRGRGKPRVARQERQQGGLIPARAGKTSDGSQGGQSGSAHPRAGGENSPGPSRRAVRAGSSPRGRGKRVLAQ